MSKKFYKSFQYNKKQKEEKERKHKYMQKDFYSVYIHYLKKEIYVYIYDIFNNTFYLNNFLKFFLNLILILCESLYFTLFKFHYYMLLYNFVLARVIIQLIIVVHVS